MLAIIDPLLAAARDQAAATWSARNAAWWTFGATATAATLNTAVLVYLARITSKATERERNARTMAAGLALGHALAVLKSIFERLHTVDQSSRFPRERMLTDLEAVRRAIAGAPELTDEAMIYARSNTSTMVEVMNGWIASHDDDPVSLFMQDNGGMERTVDRLIEKVDDRYKALSKK